MAMDLHAADPNRPNPDSYLFGRKQAWFAFAMTVALMLVDYIDRQVIVSLFPHLKAEWDLSDKQLGGLVSVVSITVAVGAMPIALWADRRSRVKSIFVMATVWSLACISCMFTRNYGQLLAARAVVGVGEAGYGSVGSALIASHFPARMRGMLMASFFAAGSFGSVLGVMLGALGGSVIRGLFKWEACEDPRELGRQVGGAAMMGIGGVVAMGCSVGQGVSAFAALAWSGPVTLAAILVGAYIGLRQLISGYQPD